MFEISTLWVKILAVLAAVASIAGSLLAMLGKAKKAGRDEIRADIAAGDAVLREKYDENRRTAPDFKSAVNELRRGGPN